MRGCPFQLGSYRGEESLVHSGAGVLYRAQGNTWPGGPPHYVGLFLLDENSAKDGVLLSRFRDGLARSAGLSHPNLMQVLEFGESKQETFVVTDWVPGRPISRFSGHLSARNRPWPVTQAICVAIEVAKALSFLQSYRDPLTGGLMQLTHGFVRPQGIMVTFGGAVKLVPLPMAWAEAYSEGLSPPDVLYSAPEQLLGWDVDPRSDIFSLGVVLWEMLTGSFLFNARYTEERKKQLFEMPLEPPSARVQDVPPELDKVVMRMMDRDPYLRYQVAEEVIRDLSAVLKFRFGSASLGEFAAFCLEEFKEVRENDLSGLARNANPDGETKSVAAGEETRAIPTGEETRPIESGASPIAAAVSNEGARRPIAPVQSFAKTAGPTNIVLESGPAPMKSVPNFMTPSVSGGWGGGRAATGEISFGKIALMGVGAFLLMAAIAFGMKKGKFGLKNGHVKLASLAGGSDKAMPKQRKAYLWTEEREISVEVDGEPISPEQDYGVTLPEGISPPYSFLVNTDTAFPVNVRVRKPGFQDFVLERTFRVDQDFQIDVDLKKLEGAQSGN